MKKVGPNEVERQQMIQAIRDGATVEEAFAPWRSSIEEDWFDRNLEHMAEAAQEPAAAAAPKKGKGRKGAEE